MNNENLTPDNHETSLSKCHYCGSEMDPKAIVCKRCLHYKQKVLNLIKHFASTTALVMVVLAVVQLILAFGEKYETKKMFDEIETVKNEANLIFEDVKNQEKLLTQRLSTVKNDVDEFSKHLKELRWRNKLALLSDKAIVNGDR